MNNNLAEQEVAASHEVVHDQVISSCTTTHGALLSISEGEFNATSASGRIIGVPVQPNHCFAVALYKHCAVTEKTCDGVWSAQLPKQ